MSLEVLPVEMKGVNVAQIIFKSLSNFRFRKEIVGDKGDNGLQVIDTN
jgi:hypothetical protein